MSTDHTYHCEKPAASHQEVEVSEWDSICKNILPEGFAYHLLKHEMVRITSKTTFVFSVKELKSKSDILAWKASFQANNRWRTKEIRKPTERLLFRLRAVCQHQTQYQNKHSCKNKQKRKRKYSNIKNTGCPATLTINLKSKGNMGSSEAVVKLNLAHNHQTASAASYGKNRVSEETTRALEQLFVDGHSPISALSHLKMTVEEDVVKLANRSIIPSSKFCSRLDNKLKKIKYGEFQKTTAEMREALQIKLENEDVKFLTGLTESGQMVVSLMTPLMERSHNLRESAEIVFLDASGGMDGHQTRLFLLLTHCHGGGVPLGAFLTTSESEDAITMGLDQIKQLADSSGFYNRGLVGPTLFMVDDSKAEHAAINTVFPESRVLLCTFHIQQAVWRWLWNSHNRIHLRDRNTCMELFRRLLYSDSESEYMEIYESDHSCLAKYPNYANYLGVLHGRRSLWALCFRQSSLTRGNNTNNFVEAAFRLLKDTVLHRARAFNCVHLTEYLITKFENSICNRLLDIAHGRTELRHRRKRPATSSATIKHKVGDQYEVVIGKTKRLVQADLGLCSCTYGNTGNLCKHLWAVMESAFECGTNAHHYKPLQHQREVLFWLSTGQKAQKGWLEPLHHNTCINNKTISTEREVEEHLEYEEIVKSENSYSEVDVIPKVSELQRQKWQAAIDAFHKDMSDKLENYYEAAMYGPAFETFIERWKARTASQKITLLNTPLFLGGYSFMQKRTKIGVQPSAVARRKRPLGTTTSQHGGSRRKAAEHAYGKETKKNQPAPHSLLFCVERTISLGKTHSKK
ncbi:uncharacterized protein [Watersipora subatra]|uniref:uncharacterized protein n=1 Tax=Watersipora subatra TaxID=2589382 RepID=UPI00355B4F91